MAASFPNAKKTFSAVVNGVTKLVAALFNSPDDEIEAIETFIGPTGGGAQAYSDSITNLLRNYIKGCRVEYKGAADLYVRSGEIMITDADGNRRLRRNPSDTTVTWADIDTGAEANATYYVYAVADASATTFTVVISTNATTPSGCTFYRRIGSFVNNTDIVADSLSNDNSVKIGTAVAKTIGTEYLAASDGFVNVGAGTTTNTSTCSMSCVIGAASPPTTVIARYDSDSNNTQYPATSICFPVPKGYYYKVTVSNMSLNNVMWFTPIN